MNKRNPYVALPIITAAVGVFALFWIVAFTILAMFLSTLALGIATATADHATGRDRPGASTVVPVPWPKVDHMLIWSQHIPPRDEILLAYGSTAAADEAGAVASSSAWAPTPAQRPWVLTAYAACLTDGHDNFVVSKLYASQITPTDCQQWWAGTDQSLLAFRGW